MSNSSSEARDLERLLTAELDRRQLLGRTVGGLAAAGGLAAFLSTRGTPVAQGATRRRAATPTAITVTAAGPVLAVNPEGPGQNNLPSTYAWFSCYDSLVDFFLPASLAQLKGFAAKGELPVQPALAESWDVNKAKTIYRFHLRKGAKSSFGRELTADDVVWSLTKSIAGKATGAFILGPLAGFTDVKQMRKIDGSTIEIKLPAPAPRLLFGLGFGWPVIYDSTEVKKHVTAKDPWANTWLNLNTAGFGPYAISSYEPGGKKLIFTRREDYWGEKPSFEKITQTAVSEGSSRLQLLLSGDAHYAPELTPLQVEQVNRGTKAKVTQIADTTSAYLALTNAEPWNDPKIRQAIARAIPYDDILKTVFRGQGQRQKSVLAPFVEGYGPYGWKWDTNVEAAKAVLSTVTAPLTLAYGEGLPVDEQIALLCQSSFKKAGFDLKVEKQPRAQFDGRKYGHKELQFFVDVLDTPGIPTPDYSFLVYGLKTGIQSWFGYDSPRLGEIIVLLTTETDVAKRRALIQEGQRIMNTDLPIMPICWTGKAHAHAPFIKIPGAHTGNQLIHWQDLKAVS